MSVLPLRDEIEIRDFAPSHQEAAARLINTSLGEHFGFEDPTQSPDIYDIASSYRGEDFLPAVAAGSVIGTGALVAESDGIARVVRMHTDKTFRRHRVGTEILRKLEARALQRGFRETVLDTNLDWHDAIGFYIAAGYAEVARNEHGIRFHKRLSADNERA